MDRQTLEIFKNGARHRLNRIVDSLLDSSLDREYNTF